MRGTPRDFIRSMKSTLVQKQEVAAYPQARTVLKITDILLDDNVYLFHASTLMADGCGIAFTAPSGTGKSTHARLWRENIPGVTMINDDKPFLKVAEDGTVLVCGSPWNGKHELGENIMVPLKAIYFVKRADPYLPAEEQNQVIERSPIDSFRDLYVQIYRPDRRDRMQQTMDFMNHLMHSVKLYELRCNMETEAAKAAYEAYFGGA